jgi:hypothetical protein
MISIQRNDFFFFTPPHPLLSSELLLDRTRIAGVLARAPSSYKPQLIYHELPISYKLYLYLLLRRVRTYYLASLELLCRVL